MFSRSIQLDKTFPEPFKSQGSVLSLGAVFCGNDCDPGGEVSQTDSGLSLVLPLAARATGPVGLDDHLFFKDLRISIKFHSPTPQSMGHRAWG